MCPSLTMKHLAREVIERHAFSSGHFRRGEGCAKLIRNVKSTMVEDGIQFIGQCEYGLHLCFTETALPNSCFAEKIHDLGCSAHHVRPSSD